MKDLSFYMSLNYKIEILREEEGTGYVFHCPELPGCITSAENVEEGMRLIEDAKKCWITACLEDGIPVPEPSSCESYSGQFKLRIPKSLHKSLSENSKREGISMNQYCLYLLSKNNAEHSAQRI